MFKNKLWQSLFAGWVILQVHSVAGSSRSEAPLPPPALALELGAPFRDNAILQQQIKVPFWGWSKPETTVSVTFMQQRKTATVGKDGKWMVWLTPLKASI